MLICVIAILLVLGAGGCAVLAMQAHVRHEEDAKRCWLWSAVCLAALIVGFLVIRFLWPPAGR